MKKNILVSFAWYILVGILTVPFFIVYLGFLKSNVDSNDFPDVIFGFVCILFAAALYFLAGKYILEPLEDKLKNFFSVWILGIVLLLLTIPLIISGYVDSWSNFGMYYVYTNPTLFAFFGAVQYLNHEVGDIPLISVCASFIPALIPSVFLWLGMKSNMKKTAKQTISSNIQPAE